jgi:hypothetical protein
MGLMSPVATALERQRQLASPLPEPYGVVAGFLDNRKNNADKLLIRISEVLQARYAFSDVLWRSKFIFSRPADPRLLEELAARCQFVVTAIGD